MRPIVVSVGPLAAASANGIALSQTPNAGALTLNGLLVVAGVAVLDVPRQILLTTTADETAHTFTITGTGVTGQTQSESFLGVNNATKASALDYKTVTAITISANATSALTVGTNTAAGSPWVRFDGWGFNAISIQCTTTGTVNYTVQTTMDDPNSSTNAVALGSVTWINTNDTGVVAATGPAQSNFFFVPTFARVLLNSGTGTVTTTFLQASGVVA